MNEENDLIQVRENAEKTKCIGRDFVRTMREGDLRERI